MEDWQILVVFLTANEVVADMKRRKKKGMVLRVDFETYDMVNWAFLDKMLSCKGFG